MQEALPYLGPLSGVGQSRPRKQDVLEGLSKANEKGRLEYGPEYPNDTFQEPWGPH